MEFLQHYQEFLNRLETISEKHDELTDTDVRERLHEVINWYFVWGNPLFDFPQYYSMFSKKGNKLVSTATKKFITATQNIVTPIGQERNDLLENPSAITLSGQSYDTFIGSIDTVLPPTKPTPDSIYLD